MWFIPIYVLILFLTIVVDYYAAILIANTKGKLKKTYLIISIITTCLILFFFKYYNFFYSNLMDLAELFGLHYPKGIIDIILPIGLSFHTFQSLSYVIEVYRGEQKPETHFGIYSLYVMFYPQLVAGPIERPQNLLHQFRENYSFSYERTKSGVSRMLWGLFKKVVIADRLSIVVSYIYADPSLHNGVAHSIATIFFAFQIYCDFSGYSDVALGASEVMGFKLMENFRSPYFSKSISDFWSRWHISLSTWFKDYLYIPLGGNRKSFFRWQSNLLVTFIASGFWHGANWTYVAWGAINGFYLVSSNVTVEARRKFFVSLNLNRFPVLVSTFQLMLTFTLICISWIFFRSETISDAVTVFKKFPTGWRNLLNLHLLSKQTIFGINLGISTMWFAYSVFLIISLMLIELFLNQKNSRLFIKKMPTYQKAILYYIAVLMIIFLGVYGEVQFIYFQF